MRWPVEATVGGNIDLFCDVSVCSTISDHERKMATTERGSLFDCEGLRTWCLPLMFYAAEMFLLLFPSRNLSMQGLAGCFYHVVLNLFWQIETPLIIYLGNWQLITPNSYSANMYVHMQVPYNQGHFSEIPKNNNLLRS